MENIILGFLTGGSLILVIGPQNLFVIEQGLKKSFVFTVTTICTISDIFLIFLGIFIYHIFSFISLEIEIILNIILILFLTRFVKNKFDELKNNYKLKKIKQSQKIRNIILKTLGFTYLNPHVYSDTVFFLGNFSKNFFITHKYLFGLGASIASFIFFFALGYLSKFLSKYSNNVKTWDAINTFIIMFMGSLALYILIEIFINIRNYFD